MLISLLFQMGDRGPGRGRGRGKRGGRGAWGGSKNEQKVPTPGDGFWAWNTTGPGRNPQREAAAVRAAPVAKKEEKNK